MHALRLSLDFLTRVLDDGAQDSEQVSATFQCLSEFLLRARQTACLFEVLSDEQVLDGNCSQSIRSLGEAQVGHGGILVRQHRLALQERPEERSLRNTVLREAHSAQEATELGHVEVEHLAEALFRVTR